MEAGRQERLNMILKKLTIEDKYKKRGFHFRKSIAPLVIIFHQQLKYVKHLIKTLNVRN